MNYLLKKKQAFMTIVNSIKGFLRSVSGIPPITLEKCVDNESLVNYQIFGNSIQDGEPSPAAPVVVESVGEKTKNLLQIVEGYNTNGGNATSTVVVKATNAAEVLYSS